MFKDSDKFYINEQGKFCYKKTDSSYASVLKGGIDFDTRFYMENQLVYIIEINSPDWGSVTPKSNCQLYPQIIDFDYECNYNYNYNGKSKNKTSIKNKKYENVKKIISKKRSKARKNLISNLYDYEIEESNIDDDDYDYYYFMRARELPFLSYKSDRCNCTACLEYYGYYI